MKLTSLFCTSLLALSAMALVADGALAATTVKTSKSNASERIDPRDPAGAKKCTDRKGTVATDAAGNKYCIGGTPPTGGSPLEATTLASSKSNTMERIDPAKACTDAGGTVATDAAGVKYCVKQKPATPVTPPPAN